MSSPTIVRIDYEQYDSGLAMCDKSAYGDVDGLYKSCLNIV